MKVQNFICNRSVKDIHGQNNGGSDLRADLMAKVMANSISRVKIHLN